MPTRKKFYKYIFRSNALAKIDNLTTKEICILNLQKNIQEIDKEIANLASGIFEASLVKFRIAFDNNRGILGNLQKRIYSSAAEQSVSWHSHKLTSLIKERKEKKKKLEKIQGVYWFKKIKKLFALTLIGLGLLILGWIAILGLVTAIYLLPIWLSIVFVAWYIQKKRS